MKSDQDKAAKGTASTSAKSRTCGALLDSLDQEVDQDAEAAWEVEIDRRLRDLDSGAVRPIPWSEARLKTSGR